MAKKRHTFKVTFENVDLTKEMQDRIAAAVRKAALFEITALDRRADFLPRLASVSPCGSGCRADVEAFASIPTAELRGESSSGDE